MRGRRRPGDRGRITADGSGLHLAQQVVGLHGGRLEVHSAGLGQGSEFIVRLPLLPRTSDEPQPERRAEIDRSDSAARSLPVLIVDDNADAADSMAMLVGSWGHEVAVARDSPGAIALAGRFRPEVALVDIGLPGMNGYELARRLREAPLHRELYLVALTGFGRDSDRSAALEAGFSEHFVKPADIGRIEKLLASGDLTVPAGR